MRAKRGVCLVFVYEFVLVLVSVHMPVSVSMSVHVHLTLLRLLLLPVSLVVSLLVRFPGLVPRCSCGCVSLLGKCPPNSAYFIPN